MTQYAKYIDCYSIIYPPKNYNGISNYHLATEMLLQDGYLKLKETKQPGSNYFPKYEIKDNTILQTWEKIEETPLTYAELRSLEYPSVGDMIDAICKKFDGDSTEYDKLQEQRLKIKEKYPKEIIDDR